MLTNHKPFHLLVPPPPPFFCSLSPPPCLPSLLFQSRAVWFIILQIITATELSGLETTAASTTLSLQCQVCRLIPGLTPSQQDVCCDIPKAISLLQMSEHSMQTECKWQLRKELWNCSEIGMPIFRAPNMPGEFKLLQAGMVQGV